MFVTYYLILAGVLSFLQSRNAARDKLQESTKESAGQKNAPRTWPALSRRFLA